MKRSSKIEVFPRHYAPMFATLVEMPKEDKNFAYEYKWDGARAISYWNGKELMVHSRNLNDVTFRYPELQELSKALGKNNAVLDGEIVALGDEGFPDFKSLTHRMHVTAAKVPIAMIADPVYYYIFDILYINGREVINEPYTARRAMLESLNINTDYCKVPPYYLADGEHILQVAIDNGLEGIMIKKLDSKYQPGARNKDWLKVKVKLEQELVIGGWIEETKSNSRIGSLLVGYNDEKGDFVYAGRVGTGYNDADHKELLAKLSKIESQKSPFTDLDKRKPGVHYVKPKLVAQVQYRRWYSGGNLQQSSFKGLRYDKKASEVVRENPRQA